MGIKDQDLEWRVQDLVVPFLAGVALDVFAGVASDMFAGMVSSFRLLSSFSSGVSKWKTLAEWGK
jgi:hypothetical protein